MIQENTIAFIPTKGMTSEDRLAIHFLAGIQHRGHTAILTGIDSFFYESPFEICVRAHDRAPKTTSQVHLRRCSHRWRVESVCHVEIQVTVIVQI